MSSEWSDLPDHLQQAAEPDVPSEPHRAAVSAIALSKAQWEAVEDVSPETRAVGQMFARAAEWVSEGKPARPSPLAWSSSRWATVTRASCSMDETLAKFLRRARELVSQAAAPVRMKNPTRTMAMKTKMEEERVAKLLSQQLPASLPRVEAYGAHVEVWVAHAVAFLLKLESFVDRVVSLQKLLGTLEDSRAESGAAAVRQEIARELQGKSHKETLAAVAGEETKLLDSTYRDSTRLWVYPDQERLVDVVLAATHPTLVAYRTPPSGGKTAAAALLGSVWAKLGRSTFVVYACFSNAVRMDVAKTLIASETPFAIVSNGVANPSFRCYFSGKSRKRRGAVPPELSERIQYSVRLCEIDCDRRPAVMVCDMASALAWVKQRRTDVLLLDEPTAKCRSALDDNCALLAAAPRTTVLLSATVPSFERMPAVVAAFRERHGPDSRVELVESNRLSLNITCRDITGRVWAPHHVTTKEELPEGFLRFYSAPALLELSDYLEGTELVDLFSHSGLRRAARHALAKRDAVLAAPEETQETQEGVREELRTLCTSRAWKWAGTTLVVVDSVERFYEESVQVLSADEPLSLRKRLRLLDRAAKKSTARIVAVDEETNKPTSEGLQGELEESCAARDDGMKWPPECVVNSAEHLARYCACRHTRKRFPSKALKGPVPLSEEVLHGSNERVVTALVSGVALLESCWGDASFETQAVSLADSRRLSFVAASPDILYGTNLNIDRVIVVTGAVTSPTELLQLCGRVGRTGKGVAAEIVFCDPRIARAAVTPATDSLQEHDTLDASFLKWTTGGHSP